MSGRIARIGENNASIARLQHRVLRLVVVNYRTGVSKLLLFCDSIDRMISQMSVRIGCGFEHTYQST